MRESEGVPGFSDVKLTRVAVSSPPSLGGFWGLTGYYCCDRWGVNFLNIYPIGCESLLAGTIVCRKSKIVRRMTLTHNKVDMSSKRLSGEPELFKPLPYSSLPITSKTAVILHLPPKTSNKKAPFRVLSCYNAPNSSCGLSQ